MSGISVGVFDVAVVGLGLIGSAALRELAESGGASVVGIGPAEPADRSTWDGPFASHHDSGRITRRLDARHEWAVLASRSIEHYPRLVADSGVAFHSPTGLVFCRNDEVGIANQRDVIRRLELPVEVSTVGDDGRVGEHAFPPGWTVLSEPGPAGHIDPRALVRAQLVLAEAAGAGIHRTFVTAAARTDDGWRVTGPSVDVRAREVLFCTGPYHQGLHGHTLEATVRPEAVILGEVDETEALRLADLPSAIHLLDHPDLDDVYMNPPIRYPDGRWYLKMGGSHSGAGFLETDEAKRAWMSGDAAEDLLPTLRDVLVARLPDVEFRSFSVRPCLISDTASHLPYVGRLPDEGSWIAAGGNGHSAKSSDAIGSLAARMVLAGGWPDGELLEDAFRPRLGVWRPGEGSRHGN